MFFFRCQCLPVDHPCHLKEIFETFKENSHIVKYIGLFRRFSRMATWEIDYVAETEVQMNQLWTAYTTVRLSGALTQRWVAEVEDYFIRWTHFAFFIKPKLNVDDRLKEQRNEYWIVFFCLFVSRVILPWISMKISMIEESFLAFGGSQNGTTKEDIPLRNKLYTRGLLFY